MLDLTKGDVRHFARPCTGIKVIQGNVLYADNAAR
jgi:hypothetical protein